MKTIRMMVFEEGNIMLDEDDAILRSSSLEAQAAYLVFKVRQKMREWHRKSIGKQSFMPNNIIVDNYYPNMLAWEEK